jgi:hypothetical protein
MSKKLEHNGLWESSRMMLPQHKEAFTAAQQKIAHRQRPIIHDDEYELMVRHIKESYYTKKRVVIELFHETESIYMIGHVHKIDEQSQRIEFSHEDELVWLNIGQITNVRNRPNNR